MFAIIILSKEGYFIRKIAEKIGVSKSCMRYCIVLKKLRWDLQKFVPLKKPGRPRKTIEIEDHHIITTSKRNRKEIAFEITAEINASKNTTILISIVKKRFAEGGLKGYAAVKKSLLRRQNKKKRGISGLSAIKIRYCKSEKKYY